MLYIHNIYYILYVRLNEALTIYYSVHHTFSKVYEVVGILVLCISTDIKSL